MEDGDWGHVGTKLHYSFNQSLELFTDKMQINVPAFFKKYNV